MITEEYKNTIYENYMRVLENVENAKTRLGINYEIEICAATKTVSAESINYAASIGLSRIGENRVSELVSKYDEYDKSLKVDYIGALQTNKINKIVGCTDLIQSLDNLRAAAEIDSVSKKKNIISKCLIEINIAREENKNGILPEQTESFLSNILEYKNILPVGLMTIGAIGSEYSNCKNFFGETYQIFIDIYKKKLHNITKSVLSMGMSADYINAIENGANMIRPGSAIFGTRTSIK